jgi:hypothetical protein
MNEPVVSFKALCAARSTLEDFCLSYFMFYGLDGGSAITNEHLPLLTFVESAIYAADEANEQLLTKEKLKKFLLANKKLDKTAVNVLCSVLEERQLLDGRVKEQLQFGHEYWELERKICTALSAEEPLEVEDVIRAIELKSFDYRILNLLLAQLTGNPYDDDAIDFLWYSEVLIEIGDDLVDYEEDVLENSFNILRCFVRLFGTSAPIRLTALISELEALYEQKLSRLDSTLQASYRKRCKDAMGKHSTSDRWMVPPIIQDEAAFIAQVQCTSEGRAHEAIVAELRSRKQTGANADSIKSSMRRLNALRDRQAMRGRFFCACATDLSPGAHASMEQEEPGGLLARVLENERKQTNVRKQPSADDTSRKLTTIRVRRKRKKRVQGS